MQMYGLFQKYPINDIEMVWVRLTHTASMGRSVHLPTHLTLKKSTMHVGKLYHRPMDAMG